jgi:hypothetical protein
MAKKRNNIVHGEQQNWRQEVITLFSKREVTIGGLKYIIERNDDGRK